MILLDKEYYLSPFYFFLREKNDKLHLYYNYSETINEARKSDLLIEFKKSSKKKIKSLLSDILKQKKVKNKKELKKELEDFKTKEETTEMIDSDGSWSTSRIPILDPRLAPRKTTDQTVYMSTTTNDPITRGYRVYYGESEIKETDLSKVLGYEETKTKDGPETFKFFKNELNMSSIEADKRTRQLGKKPSKKNTTGKKSNPDKITLSEIQRQEMIKIVEDIVKEKDAGLKKRDDEKKQINKFLETNLKSIKNMASQHGISINQLISILKKSE